MARMQNGLGSRLALSSLVATFAGTGLALFLSTGVGAGCSFYLPERTVCTGDAGCGPTDMGAQADMAKDPSDPSAMGPYLAASLTAPTAPAGISKLSLIGPSDDGSSLSSKESTYPLVLMAPPEFSDPALLRPYADRLASHGFLVALFQPMNETNHTAYRDAAKALLDVFVANATQQRIDPQRLGLVGYQLSGKIAASLAAVDTRIGGLFLIDPVDSFTASGPIDGIDELGKVTLAGGATVALIGTALATTGNPPCVQQSPRLPSYQDFFSAARMPAVGISFGGANLADFVEGYYDSACYKDSTAPRTRTQDLAKKYMTAYFQWSLKARARSREYLLGNDFNADQQAAMLTRLTK
jgi:hypothetical protein